MNKQQTAHYFWGFWILSQKWIFNSSFFCVFFFSWGGKKNEALVLVNLITRLCQTWQTQRQTRCGSVCAPPRLAKPFIHAADCLCLCQIYDYFLDADESWLIVTRVPVEILLFWPQIFDSWTLVFILLFPLPLWCVTLGLSFLFLQLLLLFFSLSAWAEAGPEFFSCCWFTTD